MTPITHLGVPILAQRQNPSRCEHLFLNRLLEKLAESCRKRKHRAGVLERRIGRLLERNSRAAALFEVAVEEEAGRPQVVWSKHEAWREWAHLSEGCYLLRSNITEWSGAQLWEAYIQLTQAEAAFRIHKQDLALRPIWHQKAERVEAHILVCFLAYVLWKALGQLCARAGLGEEPRKVLEELGQLRVVDVVVPTRDGTQLRRRCVAEPTKHQAILLQRLGLALPKHLEMCEV